MNKIKIFNKRNMKIFIIFILPILFSTIILFNPFEEIPVIKNSNSGNNTGIVISEDLLNHPSFLNSIRNIFEVPFDLKWYYLCFSNGDTKITYPNGTIEGQNMTIFSNGKAIVKVPRKDTQCILQKINEPFHYNMTFNFIIHINYNDVAKVKIGEKVGDLPTRAEWKVYARPEIGGIITKNILFFIAWLALILLINEARKFIIDK